MLSAAVDIHPLTSDLLQDYLSFFDQDAFVDNPDWASCYCYFHHAPQQGAAWERRTAAENRAAVGDVIRCGEMQGYLAYAGGKPIAWCHAAPRTLIPNLQRDADLWVDDIEQVGAIVCFVVAEPYRRQGVARQLLDAACQGFRALGLTYAEAYPRLHAHSDAANYHGPLTMYRDSGFTPFRLCTDFEIVRKILKDVGGNNL